jgi:hypothetical protein
MYNYISIALWSGQLKKEIRKIFSNRFFEKNECSILHLKELYDKKRFVNMI